jgi:hypothetical protein
VLSVSWDSVQLMGWVRRRRRFGAWLALAALALQMAVSFGHVHLHGLRPVAPRSALAGAYAQTVKQLPAPQPASGDDDGYCAICATIYLAANSFVPQAPQLPLPVGEERIEQTFVVVFATPEPPRVAFHSRAPPLA